MNRTRYEDDYSYKYSSSNPSTSNLPTPSTSRTSYYEPNTLESIIPHYTATHVFSYLTTDRQTPDIHTTSFPFPPPSVQNLPQHPHLLPHPPHRLLLPPERHDQITRTAKHPRLRSLHPLPQLPRLRLRSPYSHTAVQTSPSTASAVQILY